jgi:hypothetical protein
MANSASARVAVTEGNPPETVPIRYNPGSARPTVGEGSNIVVADFARLSGAFLNKAIFGVATGELNRAPPWEYQDLVNRTIQPGFAGLGLRFVRINGITTIPQIFGASGTEAPNWRPLNNLIAGFKTCFPLARFCFVTTNHDTFDYTNRSVRTVVASDIAQIARYLAAGGIRVDYWEVVNEPDHSAANTPAVVAALESEVRSALHAVDRSYVVGGCCTSWPQQNYARASAAAGAQFISWHTYVESPGATKISDEKLYAQGIAAFDAPVKMQAAAKAAAPGNYLTFLTEYAINMFSSDTPGDNDPRQQTYKGAIYSALIMISEAYGGLAGAGIWRLENDDGTYGVFQTGTWNLNPQGALIKALNQYMGGSVTAVSVSSKRTKKLLVMNAVTSADFGLIIINYDTTTTWTGAVALKGRASSANITRFNLDEATPHGSTSSMLPIMLNSITVPPAGLTILSGPR